MLKSIAAGIALFLATVYVAGANPEILSQAGVPLGAAIVGTFLIIIVGNLSGVLLTRSALLIGPAIGISTFFASYVNASSAINWQQGYLALIIASVCLLAIVIQKTNWRHIVVHEGIPRPLKAASGAAIGSLFAAHSFNTLNRHSVGDSALWITAMVLLASILVAFTYLRRNIEKSG
ncbi:hypothetical protein [Hyphobacterium sp.]|uniref:hypothetical protein n=1 Tax=Hyphobacterium sp. TaxID=2004662 RepID=UPI0037482D6A